MEPTVCLAASLMNSHLKRYAGLILNSFLREARYPQWVLNPQVPGPLERLQQWVLHRLAYGQLLFREAWRSSFCSIWPVSSTRPLPGASALLWTTPEEAPHPQLSQPGLSKPHSGSTPQNFP